MFILLCYIIDMENESMKRYFVTVTIFDGSLYTVEDRITRKYYPIRDAGAAFADYPGTLQELANDIEIEEVRPFLELYGTAYKLRMGSAKRIPELYMELNETGEYKKWYGELLAGMPWGPKDIY